MGRPRRFNSYDDTIKKSRDIARQAGQNRQNATGITTSFRGMPGNPPIGVGGTNRDDSKLSLQYGGVLHGPIGFVADTNNIELGILDISRNSAGQRRKIRGVIYVIPESGTTGTLDRIIGKLYDNQLLILTGIQGNTITIKHNIGGPASILCPGDTDYTLQDDESVILMDDVTAGVQSWKIISVGNNSGSGISDPIIQGFNTITPQSIPTTTNIDASSKNIHKITLDRDISLDIINPPSSGKYELIHLIFIQDNTGGRTVTWPSNINGTPEIDTAAGSVSSVILYTIDAGVTWYFQAFKGGALSQEALDGVATRELDNLRNVAINTSLLPNVSDSLDIGSELVPWRIIHTREIEFAADTSAPNVTSDTQISKQTNGNLNFNLDTSGATYQLYFAGVNRWAFSETSLSGDNIILDNTLTINDGLVDPTTNGMFANNGGIVKLYTGGALSELGKLAGSTDVNITSPANGEILEYNSALQKWVNKENTGNAQDLSDLGVIVGNFDINLSEYTAHQLYGTIMGDSSITFSNVPSQLLLELRLYIGVLVPSITLHGINLNQQYPGAAGVLSPGDFLAITITSDENNVLSILDVKKNNDTDESAPSVPTNFTFEANSADSISVSWDAPLSGTLPVTYDVVYSTSDSTDTNGTPNGADAVWHTGLTETRLDITGLSPSTRYYGWIRARNNIGDSAFSVLYTDTDPPMTLSLLGWSITSESYDSITAAWSALSGRQYLYDFDLTLNGETTVVRSKTLSQGFTYNGLIPDTTYDYEFRVYKEDQTQILNATGQITTLPLPVPTLVLSGQVNTVIINAQVTIPAGISKVELEDSINNTVDSDGAFTDNDKETRIIYRSIGTDITQPEVKSIIIEGKNVSTEYYFHVRSLYKGEPSDWSGIQSVTTGKYLPPGSITGLSATSPGPGQVRLKWRWHSVYRGEQGDITRYQSGILGSHSEGFLKRSGDSDDLDDREDRAEMILDNQPSGEQWTYVVTPTNGKGSVGGADIDTVIID